MKFKEKLVIDYPERANDSLMKGYDDCPYNNVSKQEKETQKAEKMMTMVDTLLDIFEFELVVELKIKNKKTGKVYKR